ncbi:MAG: hypothetical protein M5U26_27905 [Planctomycetota bacterium]|nr:hypothetical protein [Planctomycetota bacterium]
MSLEQALELARKARQSGLFAAVTEASAPAAGLAGLGALLVTGSEAAAFLQGQLTNEVAALKPGEGNLNARADSKGRLLRLLSVHALPDEAPAAPGFLLLLDRDGVPDLREDLDRYQFSDAVELDDASDAFDWILLQGPAAPGVVSAALPKEVGEPLLALPDQGMRMLAGEQLPPGAFALNLSLTGDSGYVLGLPAGAAEDAALVRKLRAAASARELIEPAPGLLGEVLEVLRIEAGIPRRGGDYEPGARVLPETGLEQQVVSYAKGCFVGQEVIARIRTYGAANRALRGLVLEGAPAAALADLPAAGADLALEDGTRAGEIASRTYSPMLEAPVAFAYLDKARRTPGGKLAFKGPRGTFKARVVLLPFYHARDRAQRARFLHDRAVRSFAEHRDDAAIALLEEALRADPSYADGYEALGVMLGRRERFHEAIDIFKRLEEVAPNEPMVHTNLSLFYMKLGDKEAAENEKAKATVKRFSGFADAKAAQEREAAELAARKADAERKKAMFEEVLEIDAADPVALFGLGNALATLEDWDGAALVYRKAIEAQKDNSPLYLAYGKSLERLGREAEALGVYRQGIEVASRKGDLMPLKEMEHRALLLEGPGNA